MPTSIRRTNAVVHGSASDLVSILDAWLVAYTDGIGCVIGDPRMRSTSRVRLLTAELSEGLESDPVLIDPEALGEGIEAAVDRHVAMTRAAQQLVIPTSSRRPRSPR